MLYIVIATTWCLLAFIAFSMCRLAALSDAAHTRELAEWIARGGWRRREETLAEIAATRLLDGYGEARRAAG